MHTVEYGVHLSFIFSDAQKNSLEILLTFDKSCKCIFNWGKRFWIYLIICLMRLHFIDRHVQNNLCTFLLTGKKCWSGIFDYFMRFQIEIIISFCVIYIQFYRSYTGLYKKKLDAFPTICGNCWNWFRKFVMRFTNCLLRHRIARIL